MTEHDMIGIAFAFDLALVFVAGMWMGWNARKEQENSQLTMRDQFAMAALTGLLADPNVVVEGTAELAFKISDKCVEARKK